MAVDGTPTRDGPCATLFAGKKTVKLTVERPQLSDEQRAQLAEEQGLLPLHGACEESLMVVQQHQMGEKQMSGQL